MVKVGAKVEAAFEFVQPCKSVAVLQVLNCLQRKGLGEEPIFETRQPKPKVN